MENIITPTSSFDFNLVYLDNPAPLHGGSFFTKIKYTDKELPLYIQFPKCISKSGINKNNTSKKSYIDLQFNYFETDILTWMENLENKCRELIYNNRELWFQTEMLEEDIENMFISPIKPYKSGKFLIIRVHIPTTKHIHQNACLIYDENERTLTSDNITESTQFIPLVHIEGIKFSSKSFQIEINIRQIMVLSLEDNIKKTCLIKSNKPTNNIEPDSFNTLEDKIEDKIEEEKKEEDKIECKKIEEKEEDKKEEDKKTEKDLGKNEYSNNLQEINLNIEDINKEDNINLKKPNEVYYEIYKAAYDKAKQIKKAAIDAHLEAKNLKIKYNLDEIGSSEEELDELSNI